MKLTDYIIDRLFSVVMFLVAVIFSMGLLWLMELRYEFIIYIEIIFGFSFLAALFGTTQEKRNITADLWLYLTDLTTRLY